MKIFHQDSAEFKRLEEEYQKTQIDMKETKEKLGKIEKHWQ